MTSRSTNEELQTINDELDIRTAELNQLNAVGGPPGRGAGPAGSAGLTGRGGLAAWPG
jgi:hypothetical protein